MNETTKQDAAISSLVSDISNHFNGSTGGPFHDIGFLIGFTTEVLAPKGDAIKAGRAMADALTNSDRDHVEQRLHDFVEARTTQLYGPHSSMTYSAARDEVINELKDIKSRVDTLTTSTPGAAEKGLGKIDADTIGIPAGKARTFEFNLK